MNVRGNVDVQGGKQYLKALAAAGEEAAIAYFKG